MTELLQSIINLSWKEILLGVALFLISLVLSFSAIVLVVVKIPANYFSSHYQRDFLPDSPFFVRWGAVILKNLLGDFSNLDRYCVVTSWSSWARITHNSTWIDHAGYPRKTPHRS